MLLEKDSSQGLGSCPRWVLVKGALSGGNWNKIQKELEEKGGVGTEITHSSSGGTCPTIIRMWVWLTGFPSWVIVHPLPAHLLGGHPLGIHSGRLPTISGQGIKFSVVKYSIQIPGRPGIGLFQEPSQQEHDEQCVRFNYSAAVPGNPRKYEVWPEAK